MEVKLKVKVSGKIELNKRKFRKNKAELLFTDRVKTDNRRILTFIWTHDWLIYIDIWLIYLYRPMIYLFYKNMLSGYYVQIIWKIYLAVRMVKIWNFYNFIYHICESVCQNLSKNFRGSFWVQGSMRKWRVL